VLTLAQRFQNFRALGGILIKLLAFRELVRKDISARDFEQILSNTEERDQPQITTEAVIETVCQHYQVSRKDVLGEDRRQNIALARQVAMYLCRQMLGLSYPALGRAFGGKDHSTVIYSVKKITDLQDDSKEMKLLLKDLKVRCRQPL
jgi:chromosomal replication initiator protein